MTGFPFTVDERGLAHLDEATLVYEWFRSTGTPISYTVAARLAALDVSDWPEWVTQRPERQPALSHDPRKAWVGW